MYKLITSDLDETLLRKDGTISAANVTAIKSAVDAGVKFVPNTGRSFLTIQPLLQTIGLFEQPDEYVVSYNGGAVVENQNNRVVVSNAMPHEEAEKVFAIMREFDDTDIHVYTLDHLYIYHLRTDDQAYLKTRGVDFDEFDAPTLAAFKNDQIMKVIAMNPERHVQDRLYQAVMTRFNNQINCTYSSGIYVEANHLGVDKGQAVLDLGEKLGIAPDEMIAIGDNDNDLAMLRVVGMPVAVANAIDSVKGVAKYVTENDYERGVADAIAHFIN
ncbi:Cof-type HAD-IIB family hydrolase [Secundilactobacillus collinoides]|uniref:HAD superfamily hydrolase n=2 Tax=Secundilactobacillus collinoides TaxID=33960 RepID=A0A0R2BFM2_SECCO|nr:Cof-type HAD-IIB family hydrolase [Secundilactobacillus collinoides]KRM75211.1 HAD superfamily hydrolase [Secundilactobacillus collinoides DSM 20515 = JCM 1123]KZL35912.1 haloacid dehalogenase [Secundilactobacillus collinoides]